MNTRATSIALFIGAFAVGAFALHFLRPEKSDLHRASYEIEETHDDPTNLGAASDGDVNGPNVGARSIGETASAASSEQKSELAEDQSVAPVRVPETSPAEVLRVLEDYRQAPLPGTDPQGANWGLQRTLDSEKAFAAEAIDSAWAPRMESEIVEEVAQINGLDLVMLQVECRTATCRVQVTLRVGSEPLDRPSPTERAFRNELSGRLNLELRWWTYSVDRYGAAHSVTYFRRRDAAQAN